MDKAKTYVVAVIAAFTILFTGCTIESSDNGDLDGFWHLERVDSIQTGSSSALAKASLFWSFQAKLMRVTDYKNHNGDFLMRFDHNGSVLRTYDPHENDRANCDPAVADASKLKPFGINGIEDTFRVENLKGSKMVLSTRKLRLTFKKF